MAVWYHVSPLVLSLACLTHLQCASGSRINPSWFALDSSRGIESADSKVFMRATVLALDSLIYIPALLMFVRTWQNTRSKRTQVHFFCVEWRMKRNNVTSQNLSLLTLVLQPALLLVDFGHFQYNSVMLGELR
jgi:alpha-1,3-glucosyltransferase